MEDSRIACAGTGFFGNNFLWIILLIIVILPLFGFGGGMGGFASEK